MCKANKLFLNYSIVITLEFHIEIIFQSIIFDKKLFNQETLRERVAITVALTHSPRADQPYFCRKNQPKGSEIKGAQGAVRERVK
jgi:hypothetical protein